MIREFLVLVDGAPRWASKPRPVAAARAGVARTGGSSPSPPGTTTWTGVRAVLTSKRHRAARGTLCPPGSVAPEHACRDPCLNPAMPMPQRGRGQLGGRRQGQGHQAEARWDPAHGKVRRLRSVFFNIILGPPPPTCAAMGVCMLPAARSITVR